MEPGYKDGGKLSADAGDNDCFQVEARCWASYAKSTRRRLYVQLDRNTLHLKDSYCGCTAGLNACSHASGLLQYLAFLARSCGPPM